jgi:DNA-binding transcriptional regulator YiaG
VDLEGLHDTIARALVSKPSPLTGDELRFLRNELDVSQKSLASTFGISEQSIARWEKQGEASPEGDRLMRLVYAGTKWGDRKLAPFIAQLNQIDQKQSQEKMILRERHKSWERQVKAA